MSQRPYFRYSGKEIEDLFERSKEDINVLEALKKELSYRKRNKSRLLEDKIDKALESINTYSGSNSSTNKTIHPVEEIPKKYVVECSKCHTPNFIYALDDKVQYLSCAYCSTPFEAQLKQGVLRTTFKSEPIPSSELASSNNLIIYVLLASIIIILSIYLLN